MNILNKRATYGGRRRRPTSSRSREFILKEPRRIDQTQFTGRRRIKTTSASETKLLGRRIGRLLKKGDVVALIGELGSGKTTLIKGMAKGLSVRGGEDGVSSPTFTLIHEYEGREKIYHMDWYRLDALSGADESLAEECFYSDAVTLVEWADRAKEILPKGRLEIRLKHAGGDERVLNLSARGDRYKSLLAGLSSQRK